MTKERKTSIVTLCTIFIILLVPLLIPISSGDARGSNSNNQGTPSTAGNTPIPNTYTSWFNGSIGALNGHTSFSNTTYGNLTVNNSYAYPMFHNGTIDLTPYQISGYNINAVNVSIFTNTTNATIEENSTTSPNPPFVTDTDMDYVSKATGTNKVGLVQEFWLNYPVNLTTLQAYSYVLMQAPNTNNMYFQIRNDSTGTLNTNDPALYQIGFNSDTDTWNSYDWHTLQVYNDLSAGKYFAGLNSSGVATGLSTQGQFYFDTTMSGTYDYKTGALAGSYSTTAPYYPLAIRWGYIPLNDSDWTKYRTFNLDDVMLQAMANYTTAGQGTGLTRFYNNQSLLLHATPVTSIQNVTLTSNMSCTLQYNLTLFYNATTLISFNVNFTTQRFTNTVFWNVISPTFVTFPSGTWLNGTINVTGIPTGPTGWTFQNGYNSSDGITFVGWNNITIAGGVLSAFNLTQNSIWWFNFTSSNLLQDIIASSGGTPISNIINVGSVVNFTGFFTSAINDGNLTIAVYGPEYRVPRNLAYSGWNDTDLLTKGGIFNNVSAAGYGWDTSSLLDYGNYTVQLRWNDSTGAGFFEKNYSLWALPQMAFAGSTVNNTILVTPANNTYNVTLFYSDPRDSGAGIIDLNTTTTFQTKIYVGINAPLNYTTTATYNGTPGFYNVTLYFGLGKNISTWGINYINITATRPYAQNVSIFFNATYLNQTDQVFQNGINQLTEVNGQNATFSASYIYYGTSAPIAGATFSCTNLSFQPYSSYSAPYYQVSFNTSLAGGSKTPYQLTFNLTSLLNETQVYNVWIHVLNKTLVSVVAVDQQADFSYGHYNDTGSRTDNYYGSPADIVTAYYGATFNVTTRYFDRNNSLGIDDQSGAPTLGNLTINGFLWAQQLIAVTSDGNFSTKVNLILAPGNYNCWVNFSDNDAWNATYRNFTIQILPCPTGNNTVTLEQANNYNPIWMPAVGNTFTIFYGADLNFAWQMYNMLNGTNVAGQNLNGSIGTQGNPLPLTFYNVLVGSHSIVLNLNQTGYNNQSVTVTVIVVSCPVIVSIDMWQYGFQNATGSNFGPYTGKNISIAVQFANAENGSTLTAVDLYYLTFNGVTNFTASTWFNNPWFNGTLDISGLTFGLYTAWVNMTKANYAFANVTFDLTIIVTKSVLAFSSIAQGTSTIVYEQDGGYYDTTDNTTAIVITFIATNILDNSFLTGGTLTVSLSDGTLVGTTKDLGAGVYQITIDPTLLRKNNAVLLNANFSLATFQNSTVAIKVFIEENTTPPPPPNQGIPIIDIIYVVAAVAVVAVIGLIYAGPVKKSKKRRQEELVNTASSFEDSINLQHILVIYKNTGTCIYFKSFARESIDPDLISGFLSAVSTFGTEMKVDQALDEMKYGESVLVLHDGELVRVTLVLSKSPSSILRANLGRFTVTFEENFREKLVNWRGQLGIFEGADDLVDNILNANIILPHEIGDLKNMKLVKSPLGRYVLRIAQQMTSGDRKFFFLASLVSDSSEALKKTPAEILIAIDQLRKANVITPIKIEQFKTGEVSQQELQLIRQQVQQLKIAPEELEPMVSALAKMEPVEREAALTSMRQGTQIKTELAPGLAEVKKVASPDEASVELKNLEKMAKALLKKKDMEKVLATYRSAELLAFQWNLKEQANHFREVQLDLETKQLQTAYTSALKDAKKAEAKDRASAVESYKKALEAAQKLFKRGIATAEKDVVTLTATVKRLEGTPSEERAATEIQKPKKDLLNERKDLLGQMKALEKQEMWAKLEKICLRLEQISNELYKMGDMTEAKNVKLYRKQASKYAGIAASMQEDQSAEKPKDSE